MSNAGEKDIPPPWKLTAISVSNSVSLAGGESFSISASWIPVDNQGHLGAEEAVGAKDIFITQN